VCRSLDRNEAVIKDVLGLSKVDLAMNVYDKSSPEDIRAGLRVVAAICYQAVCYQRLQAKEKRKWKSVSNLVQRSYGERGRNRTFNLLMER